MIFKQKFGVEGDFEISKGKTKETLEVVAPRQMNAVLDIGLRHMSGWNREPSGSSYNPTLTLNRNYYPLQNRCAVGTGTTAVTNGDVGLAAFLAESNDSAYNGGRTYKDSNGLWVMEQRYQYTFPVGRATGILTELGLCQGKLSEAAEYLNWFLTRALIKDASGNPTAVTVLPDELLQISYSIRIYLDDGGDVAGTLMDGSTTINTVNRPSYRVTSAGSPNISFDSEGSGIEAIATPGYAGGTFFYGPESTIGALTSGPNAGSGGGTVSTSYMSVTKARHATLNRIDKAVTISALAGAMQIGAWYGGQTVNHQTSFLPRINKTADESITINMSYEWGRFSGTVAN